MADRPRHPHKEIEAVVARAGRDGCQVGVNGTPKNPEDHARQVLRAIGRCPHGGEEDR